MNILAILNEKGGVGKSTVAANLSTALHRAGRKVILVDADPQASLRDWAEASAGQDLDLPQVVALDRPTMLSSVTGLKADWVVIDGPAKADAISASIIRVATTALIVVQPSALDIWASAATVKLIQQKIELGGKIKAAFLVNRASSTNLSKQMVAGDWNEYGFPLLKSNLVNRVSYAEAMASGQTVLDLADGAAKTEINNLATEIQEWLA